MNKPSRWSLRVPGTLLALALLLQGFTTYNAKGPAPATSAPNATAFSLVVAKPQCSGLTLTGPSSVSRYSGSVTFHISNWNGACTTWYHDNIYTNTSNGYLTLYFNQWTTTGQKSITAIQHVDCSPSKAPTACGIIHYTVY
jgi:hypothetical protein